MIDREDLRFWGSIAAVIIPACALMLWAAVYDNKQWQAFAQKHNCKAISQEAPTVATVSTVTVTPNGQVSPGFGTVIVAGKTSYKCDDGVIYIR